jgi:hypothetical protein
VEVWANDEGEIVTRLADGAMTPEAAREAFEHRFDETAAAIIEALASRKLTAIVKDAGAVSAIYWKGGGAKRALFSGKVEISGETLLFFIGQEEFSGWLASLLPLASASDAASTALEQSPKAHTVVVGAGAVTAGTVARPSQDELDRWYQERLSKAVDGSGRPPSCDADESAFMERFPAEKRTVVRDLRRRHLPTDHAKGGAPKKQTAKLGAK